MEIKFCKLSNKEEEIVKLVARGYKDKEISQKLHISRRRVGEIIYNIKSKWNVASRVELGIITYHLNLISIRDILEDFNNSERVI